MFIHLIYFSLTHSYGVGLVTHAVSEVRLRSELLAIYKVVKPDGEDVARHEILKSLVDLGANNREIPWILGQRCTRGDCFGISFGWL